MAVNVYERFLRHPQQGKSARIVEFADFAGRDKSGPGTSSPIEAAYERLHGGSETAVGQLGRILHERQRPDLVADFADNVLYFADKRLVTRILLLQPRDAQLQAHNELAG